MIRKTFYQSCYVVVHDGTKVHSFDEIKIVNDEDGNPIPQCIGSGQPHVDDYPTEEEAVAAAEALGHVFETPDLPSK